MNGIQVLFGICMPFHCAFKGEKTCIQILTLINTYYVLISVNICMSFDRGLYCNYTNYYDSIIWMKCCFTSTETEGLLGTGAQDVLNFHTVPELCGSIITVEPSINCLPQYLVQHMQFISNMADQFISL